MVANQDNYDLLLGTKDKRWRRVVGMSHDLRSGLYTVFRRTADDQVVAAQLRSTAYLLVDDLSTLADLSVTVKELAGPHQLRYVAVFQNQLALNAGRKQIEQAYTRLFPENPRLHYWCQPPVPALQFRTGITFFKDMDFTDVKAMSLDIETFTANGKHFSDAADPDDRVIIISLCTNRGKQWLLVLEQEDEARLLEQLNALIKSEDPDVIVGHNLLGFDLPYLSTRAAKLGLRLRWGRDGSELWRRERKRGQPIWEASGRHLVDTLPALMQYDFTNRTLPNYQLKEAVVHLGLSADRRDFDRSQISGCWQTDRKALLAYAKADALDSLRLYQFLMPAAFFQAQILPFTFQEVCSMGTGTRVDSLIVRNYLLHGQALPLRGDMDGAADSGGLTEVLELGWVENVVKADAASLYPSICLRYGLHPRQDHLGQFLATLRELTTRRLRAKRQLKQLPAGTSEYMALDAWQGSLKILINSYYGMLGTGRLHFSDPETARAITQKGQSILRQMVNDVVSNGALPVEIDTDGIYFVLPESCALSAEDFVEQVLNSQQDDGIEIECDGVFRAMYSYAPKNYLLLSGENEIIRKGVVFRSRRLYGLQDSVIEAFGRYLAAGNLSELATYYRQVRQRIMDGHLTPEEISTYAPVRQDLTEYSERLRRGGSHNRAYDLVISRPDRSKWVERSRINYYHKLGGKLALTEEFALDYDPAVYLELLERTAEKFQYAFPPATFRTIVNCEDDLTGLCTWHFTPSQDLLGQYKQVRGQKQIMLSFLNEVSLG